MSAVTSASPAPASTRAARPAAARRRHLRVVEEPRRRHTLAYALLAIALAGATVFGTVTLNALAAGDAVAADALEREVGAQEREYGSLVAEVARLEDPARIEAAARELGLVRATSPRTVQLSRVLPADGVVNDAVAAGDTTDPLKPVLSVER